MPHYVLILIIWFLTTCIILTAASAAECMAARPPGPGYWSWRTIEGKRCWHRGGYVAKSELFWPRRPLRTVRVDLSALYEDCLRVADAPMQDCDVIGLKSRLLPLSRIQEYRP
jgi:hypothetical protein